MAARRDASLGKQLAQVLAKVGSYYFLRKNFHLTPGVKPKLTEKLRRDPAEFHGVEVVQVVKTYLINRFWVGHGFSRAAQRPTKTRALAPEVTEFPSFPDHS